MGVVGLLAIYIIAWALTLFVVLPLGVRGQHEEGPVPPGTEPGAPLAARMGRKLLLTTALAVPVAGLIWAFVQA